MDKVYVELIGNRLDLDDIKKRLKSSVWEILIEEDKYYLTSENLDVLEDNRDTLSVAKQFVEILNGVSNVIHLDHRNINVGDLKRVSADGKRHFVMITETLKLRDRLSITIIRDGVDVTESMDSSIPLSKWLEKAEENENVMSVVHFFNEITWYNLYKIYEVINRDVGGQKELYRMIDKDRISSFTNNAQYVRHAKRLGEKPTKSMNIYEAHLLIKELAEKWMGMKVNAT